MSGLKSVLLGREEAFGALMKLQNQTLFLLIL